MSVTIHFEGQLHDESTYLELVRRVREAGARHGWPTTPIDESNTTLRRVRNEEPWDYVGPTRGVSVAPHENSEPLRFEFDRDLILQEYCKTQFAGSSVHVAVVDLLRSLAPLFRTLVVVDEGEYWETSNRAALDAHIEKVHQVMGQQVTEDPSLHGPVRLPSGRIADLVRGEGETQVPARRWWEIWKRR